MVSEMMMGVGKLLHLQGRMDIVWARQLPLLVLINLTV